MFFLRYYQDSSACEVETLDLRKCVFVAFVSMMPLTCSVVDDSTAASTTFMCSECAGCGSPVAAPVEGDVRLVPLIGATASTATCDSVHLGGVELFRQGRWGRICTGHGRADHGRFTLVAPVVCRQLGYPFGTLMNPEAVTDIDADPSANNDYSSSEDALVWANGVSI